MKTSPRAPFKSGGLKRSEMTVVRKGGGTFKVVHSLSGRHLGDILVPDGEGAGYFWLRKGRTNMDGTRYTSAGEAAVALGKTW